MRKAQKRQIEETVRLMEEAHDEMKKCMEKGTAAQVGELLEDCQNAAIAIGTLIEDTEGEGHPAVTVLEEYCELVYQIYEFLSSGSSVNAKKIYKSLRKKLIKVSNSIRNDIKIRREAVFLPYKASMWDSLESVWKAADADPDCDAYVIPIPYFDRNPDGSFKEEHYEGDQYPDYVPITKYDEFDFGKHMPDVIYIHNGYDDWNLVTSVHPDFYSQNLKKYTEELVYIPYFVLGEIDPDNEQAVERMKHFCFMPGIINADKVIIQSENMKKIYIREYLKAAKECGLTGKHLDKTYLEKKFLGTGSPKLDKVLNTKKEDLGIPDEWLKIMKKPDGSFKKVIFYNTGINALLQYSEDMLIKLESVFRVFKDYKDEVALLWRPHPLIKATIESMRPQLWEAYQKIKDRYIEEGWGIYDDSTDLDRAVVLSDVYYGNQSSVLQLFLALKKFALIQFIKAAPKDADTSMKIIPLAVSGSGDDKYVLDFRDNYLYKDCGDGKCEFISDIGLGKGESGFVYMGMVKLGDDIVIIPNYGKSFLIYNSIGNTLRHIYIDKDIYANNIPGLNKPGFHKIIPYKNKIFIIKYICNVIVCLDSNTLEITYTHIFDDIEKKWYLFRVAGDCYSNGELLYIPLMDTNKFIIFDMEKHVYEIRQLQEDIRVVTVCGSGNEMYMIEMSGKRLYMLNLSEWKIKDTMIISEPKGFSQETGDTEPSFRYIGSVYYKKQLWLIPYAKANMIVKVDLENRRTECGCQYSMSQVLNYSKDGGVLWAYTDKGAIKVDMDIPDGLFTDYFHSQTGVRVYLIHKMNEGAVRVVNEQWLPLEDYIEYVTGHGRAKEKR